MIIIDESDFNDTPETMKKKCKLISLTKKLMHFEMVCDSASAFTIPPWFTSVVKKVIFSFYFCTILRNRITLFHYKRDQKTHWIQLTCSNTTYNWSGLF